MAFTKQEQVVQCAFILYCAVATRWEIFTDYFWLKYQIRKEGLYMYHGL